MFLSSEHSTHLSCVGPTTNFGIDNVTFWFKESSVASFKFTTFRNHLMSLKHNASKKSGLTSNWKEDVKFSQTQ